MKRPAVALLAGLLVGVSTALTFVLSDRHAARVLEEGETRTAQVVQVREWFLTRDIALRYKVDGTPYTVHRSSVTETPLLEAGDLFVVRVDPRDPGWATAEDLDPVPAWVEVPMLLGVPTATAAILGGGAAFGSALATQLDALTLRLRLRRSRGRR